MSHRLSVLSTRIWFLEYWYCSIYSKTCEDVLYSGMNWERVVLITVTCTWYCTGSLVQVPYEIEYSEYILAHSTSFHTTNELRDTSTVVRSTVQLYTDYYRSDAIFAKLTCRVQGCFYCSKSVAMRGNIALIIVICSFTGVLSYLVACGPRKLSAFRHPSVYSFATAAPFANENHRDATSALKKDLLDSLGILREKQARDGDFSIDFGVKGGELNRTSRAPQKVSYYAISEDVGKAADRVISICDQLAEANPTEEPTKFLRDKEKGAQSPLHGTWKLLFTTAADASFSKNSTHGDAKVKNVVDARRGRITNVIEFASKEDGTDPVLKQLSVIIKAVAASPQRVELTFRYAKAVFTKFFIFPIRWSLYIPVPGPFITRCIVLIYRFFTFGKTAKQPPKAYFDVLYLDDDLRVHKTGEDNLFVQAKESWHEAEKYLA